MNILTLLAQSSPINTPSENTIIIKNPAAVLAILLGLATLFIILVIVLIMVSYEYKSAKQTIEYLRAQNEENNNSLPNATSELADDEKQILTTYKGLNATDKNSVKNILNSLNSKK